MYILIVSRVTRNVSTSKTPCINLKNNNSKNIKVTFLFLSPTHVLSLPLSYFVASATHVPDRLTLLSVHPAPSFLLFRPIPVLSLLVPASKPRHHFPFFHASLILPVVPELSDFLRSLVLVRVFVSLAHLRAHPFSFRSHSSLAYPFLLQ
jgi:hypothetical protein